jgi:hypothetical protein
VACSARLGRPDPFLLYIEPLCCHVTSERRRPESNGKG